MYTCTWKLCQQALSKCAGVTLVCLQIYQMEIHLCWSAVEEREREREREREGGGGEEERKNVKRGRKERDKEM